MLLGNLAHRYFSARAKHFYTIWNSALTGKGFVHPLWSDVQPFFKEMILGGIPYNFLSLPIVQRMFFRSGFDSPQKHEMEYLRSHEAVWKLCTRYKESLVGQPSKDCPELGISANSLGMLYYFGRISEQAPGLRLNSIIEFGGGYGCLCRVFLELLPRKPTYVIIDLPEMLALQYVFLRASCRSYKIAAHTELPLKIKKECVNLVPVSHLGELSFSADLFVSTFALSEATDVVQKALARNKFCGVNSLYIVGQNTQAQPWKELALEPPDVIQSAASEAFRKVSIRPFHFADAWEMVASQ